MSSVLKSFRGAWSHLVFRRNSAGFLGLGFERGCSTSRRAHSDRLRRCGGTSHGVEGFDKTLCCLCLRRSPLCWSGRITLCGRQAGLISFSTNPASSVVREVFTHVRCARRTYGRLNGRRRRLRGGGRCSHFLLVKLDSGCFVFGDCHGRPASVLLAKRDFCGGLILRRLHVGHTLGALAERPNFQWVPKPADNNRPEQGGGAG